MNIRPRTIVTVALLLGPWLPGWASAQDATPYVHAGSRVRVTAPTRSLMDLRATVVETTPMGVVIRTQDHLDTVSVPYASISRLEVPHRHGNAVAGGAIGLAVGATVGMIGGVTTSEQGWSFCCTAGQTAEIALGMGVLGAGLGAVVGAMIHSDGWKTVRVPQSGSSPSSRPRGGPVVSVGSGIGIGWSLALR